MNYASVLPKRQSAKIQSSLVERTVMNVIQAGRDYVTKMVTSVSGLKVLLLDKNTTSAISMIYTQTEILQKEVFLVERIESVGRESMHHLKCIAFLRPVPENIRALAAELKEPKYGEYHLFFSNSLRRRYLEELAEADEQELVQQVQEFYADYLAVNRDTFALGVPSVSSLVSVRWDQTVWDRVVDGVVSVMLALKKKPQIRYASMSDLAQRLADDVSRRIDVEGGLFDFRRTDVPPLLLILDRREDPVTPLLSQWTYQAMVHEFIGIDNSRVDLSRIPGLRKELKEIVLSPEHDSFFRVNMFENFGDLGINLKNHVDDFQSRARSNQNIQSISDMQRFVESYPEFRKISGNVSKHVSVVSELSRIVDARSMFEVSELEQELACNQDHSAAFRHISAAIQNPNLTNYDRVRLALLYALRYEAHGSSELPAVIDLLRGAGVDPATLRYVNDFLAYCGSTVRGNDLFSNASIFSVTRHKLKRGLKGVENIFTQHRPYLADVLEAVSRGKLKESQYPSAVGGVSTKDRPQDVIVFIIGGTTYEEAAVVNSINAASGGVHIVLGGNTVLNSSTFLEEVERRFAGQSTAPSLPPV